MEKNKIYKRNEDMSHDGFIRLHMQNDGDIIIEVYGKEDGTSKEPTRVQVEFCTIGGRSPNTRIALAALADAIEKDNKENPIPD